jgi:hypothetical protein
MESVISELIPQAVQQSSLWVPVIVAVVTGGFTALGSVFGNKKLNDVNRQKYALLADKKIDVKCEKIKTKLDVKLNTIIENQDVMSEKIDHNTQITKDYNGRELLVDELKSIKREALSWSKNRGAISELVVIKSNSMISFFEHLLISNIEDLTIVDIQSEMQVQISEVKRNWEDTLDRNNIGFIDYFYEISHDEHIDAFIVDICWLLNPQRKLNNINVEKELKQVCIRFFRRSLENLLDAWDSYNIKSAGEKEE